MGAQAIDLSAGLVPKQSAVDLSAGLVPKTPESATDTRSLWQKAKDNFNANTQGAKPGDGAIKSFIEDVGAGGGDMIRAIAHPVETIKSMVNNPDPALAAVAHFAGDDTALNKLKAQPPVSVARALGQVGTGTLLGEAAGAAAGPIADAVVSAPKKALQTVARTVGGNAVDIPVMGDVVTPRDIYETAQKMGVNLDTAQATGSGVTTAAKKVTENSLGGAQKFADNARANEAALHTEAGKILDSAHPDPVSQQSFGEGLQDLLANHRDALTAQAGHPEAAQALLDSISPTGVSREQFGAGVQSVLREHAQLLNDRAGELFDQLDSKVGDELPDTSGVRKQALQIIQANQGFFDKYPQLLRGGTAQAFNIVKSLADTGSEEPTVATWSDLHKLRSSLMDIYRSPDIVGSNAEGWLKQLTGKVDQAMTGAASGLSPEDQQTFRQANQLYADMKQTYDNPQSKLYHVIRSPDALSAANSLANITRTVARQIDRAGVDLQSPELTPLLQRQTVERLLDPAGNGTPDLKGLPSRLARAQKEQLGGVLGADQIGGLKDLAAKVSEEGPYDNPRSDVYKIINAKDGNEATAAALRSGPEGIAQIQGAAKALASPETISQLQRQKIATILSPAGNDVPDLKTLPQRLANLPKEQLNNFLSPSQAQRLQDLARVAKVVHADINPSGTAKVLQATNELGAIGTGLKFAGEKLNEGKPIQAAIGGASRIAAVAAKRPIAKLLTNPEFTEAVMNATKGPEGWANRGATKVSEHIAQDPSSGLSAADVTAARGTPAGKALLVRASSLTPGSPMMKKIVDQIKALSNLR